MNISLRLTVDDLIAGLRRAIHARALRDRDAARSREPERTAPDKAGSGESGDDHDR